MELLIAVKDRSDKIDDIKAGEVIDALPDGWGWSPEELLRNDQHIICAPLLQAHVNMLCAPHTMDDSRVRGKIYPRKANLLDLTKLPNSHLLSGTRTQAKIVLQLNDVLNAIKKVPV